MGAHILRVDGLLGFVFLQVPHTLFAPVVDFEGLRCGHTPRRLVNFYFSLSLFLGLSLPLDEGLDEQPDSVEDEHPLKNVPELVKNEIVLHPVLLYTEDKSSWPSNAFVAVGAFVTALLVIVDEVTVREDGSAEVGIGQPVIPVSDGVVGALFVSG